MRKRLLVGVASITAILLGAVVLPSVVRGQVLVATTTVYVSICGDELVGRGEDCDTPTDTGEYSTSIAGRQCNTLCKWAPYCGDATLQTLYGEQCDDGNNDENDFCAADCTEETADAGGGSTGGGGSSGSGGRDTPLGDTEVTLQGKGYPNVTINILLDGDAVGTVRTNSQGDFLFSLTTDPGASSFSFWANDINGVRSSTFTTTFDVTQGAVTNVNGILLPPTIRTLTPQVNPGAMVTFDGQTAPNVTVEVVIDSNAKTLTTTSDASGRWSVTLDTTGMRAATHTAKARFLQTGTARRESAYGSVLQLFVGVEGKPTSNADLNRDGKVNLIDFSILVFWWGTPGGNSNPPADINGNAKVGLEDFSILLFNWTG
jgi:cysteine-rich repeat protein